MAKKTLGLFDAIGIEIEYMIVNKNTLDAYPIADRVIQHLAGSQNDFDNEVDCGPIAVSNELVLHVIELKTNGPTPTLQHLDQPFYHQVQQINDYLNTASAELLPTGAHPWLPPDSPQIQLWPHGDKQIYETYHRIFNCQGHGWVNLQSVHINLPFSNDEEFAKLHSAIRLLLPMIPALTASTPILEGKQQNTLDTRLQFYGGNQALIPPISGDIIPEMIMSKSQYISEILFPMYNAISPHDPKAILQYEWLNSRGAIARFDRNAIEIRIMDSQESPCADIACVAAIAGVLKYLIFETKGYLDAPCETPLLKSLYYKTIHQGLSTPIPYAQYWQQFHFPAGVTARHFWAAAIDAARDYIDSEHLKTLSHILSHGNLAERIVQELRDDKSRQQINKIYQNLAMCLSKNSLFM